MKTLLKVCHGLHDISLHILILVDIKFCMPHLFATFAPQLRRLGVKSVEAGIGCGVGIGHGFGIGRVSIWIYAKVFKF